MHNPDAVSTLHESTNNGDAPSASTPRAWSPTAIALICVFFNAIPAAIIYALNFGRMGYPQRKKQAMTIATVGSLAYILILFRDTFVVAFDPTARELLPRSTINLFNIIVACNLYLTQQKLFTQFLQHGGRTASITRPLLLSALGSLVYLGLGAGIIALGEAHSQREFKRGVALLQTGKRREAEAIFKNYKAKYPEELNARWNLALIYSQTNRVPLARQELKAMLKQEPGHKGAAQFLHELESEGSRGRRQAGLKMTHSHFYGVFHKRLGSWM